MNKEKFLNELSEALETEMLTESSELELDSMKTLAIIVFVDENFNKQLTAEELKKINSVNDLLSLIEVKF
jgi:acyl carrier protein